MSIDLDQFLGKFATLWQDGEEANWALNAPAGNA